MKKSTLRTILIVAGLVTLAAARANPHILLWLIATGLVLWGCYIWTMLKNRHWAFMLWGLLPPIGLLGIAVLYDKSWKGEVARTSETSTDYLICTECGLENWKGYDKCQKCGAKLVKRQKGDQIGA
ncbi:hypothetical protein ACFLWI_05940 [Chloroflexota bacterium]